MGANEVKGKKIFENDLRAAAGTAKSAVEKQGKAGWSSKETARKAHLKAIEKEQKDGIAAAARKAREITTKKTEAAARKELEYTDAMKASADRVKQAIAALADAKQADVDSRKKIKFLKSEQKRG